MEKKDKRKRCEWCDESSQIYRDYHDTEWAVPIGDDRTLFKMLILEGMQAGLSWLTILKKRKNFCVAFDDFDYTKIAQYGEAKITELLADVSIIRNKLKIHSAVKNACIFIDLQKKYGSFSQYLWEYVDFTPVQNSYKTLKELPAQTELSTKISKDLKKRGMNFVGPTIIYAYMQSIGMVNDHEVSCFRYEGCKELAKKFEREME